MNWCLHTPARSRSMQSEVCYSMSAIELSLWDSSSFARSSNNARFTTSVRLVKRFWQ